ncbi:MAG: hypothetical protein MZV65_44985, partial [Chromatiales bacterium]|nr:hypothetical protein [Chromatiales bacterium]
MLRAGCRAPLGVTVTRVHPENLRVEGVDVQSQRFCFPFELRARADGPRRVRFRSRGSSGPRSTRPWFSCRAGSETAAAGDRRRAHDGGGADQRRIPGRLWGASACDTVGSGPRSPPPKRAEEPARVAGGRRRSCAAPGITNWPRQVLKKVVGVFVLTLAIRS